MKISQIYQICIVGLIVYFDITSSSFIQYKEGDECDIKKSEKTCQNIKKCPVQAESVKKGLEPDVCGLRQSNLVCCSKTSKKHQTHKKYEDTFNKRRRIIKRAAPGEKSRKMCEKYAEYVFGYEDDPILLGAAGKVKRDYCGIQETPLIVGGELAKAREFPHMVLVGFAQNGTDDIYWQCGGSLISERWVISAAHCAYTKSGIASWAILGDLKVLSNDDADSSQPIQVKIVDRKVHPDYVGSKGYNDIALFKLEKDVVFNKYIRPICLNTDDKPYTGKAIASGWGRTRWQGFSSQDLLKVVLNLYDMRQCNGLFRNSRNPFLRAKIPDGITAHNMVCAWEKGKDTCQGDSGGPLQIILDKPYCMYSILGITSFGENCAKELPGVYTRVSHYVPWIESIVWP